MKDYDEGRDRAFMGYDFSLTGNYHWAEVLKLPSVLDIYSGVSVGLRTAGLQAGVRYNFSETFGLYGRCGRISSRLLAMMWNMGASIKAKQLSLWG